MEVQKTRTHLALDGSYTSIAENLHKILSKHGGTVLTTQKVDTGVRVIHHTLCRILMSQRTFDRLSWVHDSHPVFRFTKYKTKANLSMGRLGSLAGHTIYLSDKEKDGSILFTYRPIVPSAYDPFSSTKPMSVNVDFL